MNRKMIAVLAGFGAGMLTAGTALGAKLEFKDPVGDDNGPGSRTPSLIHFATILSILLFFLLNSFLYFPFHLNTLFSS